MIIVKHAIKVQHQIIIICLTCKDENIFFDLGNCRSICVNGNYTDYNNILKCKCTTNISCFYCTEESNELNLCVNYNNEEGY